MRSALGLAVAVSIVAPAFGQTPTRAAAATPEGDIPLDVQYGEFFAGGFVKRTGQGTGARALAVAVTVDSRQ